MKKILLSLALLCIVPSVSAQTASSRKGVRLGVNLSDLSGSGMTESRHGLYLGLFQEWLVAEDFGLMFDLGYSQQGEAASDYLYVIKLNYINLSPTIKWYFDYDHMFSIDLGIQTGFLVSSKLFDEGDTYRIAYARKCNIGPTLGMSIIIDPIELGVRYFAGINERHYNSSVTTISMGVRF